MHLKMRLWPKAKVLREKEMVGYKHPFSHWLMVVLGTLLAGVIFSLVGALMLFTGWILFLAKESWIKLAIGFPLILAGSSLILINLYQILAAIFDRYYSQTHCPFCRPRENLDGYYRTG